jgi:hypothetical protein
MITHFPGLVQPLQSNVAGLSEDIIFIMMKRYSNTPLKMIYKMVLTNKFTEVQLIVSGDQLHFNIVFIL